MKTISFSLSDEDAAKVESLAEREGLTVEGWLRELVSQRLETEDVRFQQAAKYVLQKNAELYRRLA